MAMSLRRQSTVTKFLWETQALILAYSLLIFIITILLIQGQCFEKVGLDIFKSVTVINLLFRHYDSRTREAGFLWRAAVVER